jgi:hypothetical protein
MTPAAIRLVSQLRQAFYTGFAAAMNLPVNVTNGNSYASNSATASWIDTRQQLNYVYVYAHTAPDALVPDRPLVLRVSLNKGAGIGVLSKRGRGCQGFNQAWSFELTVLPEEVLDFLPWIVSLIQSYDHHSASIVPEPPHPLDFQLSNTLLFHNAQTHQASRRLSKPVPAVETYAPCRAAGVGYEVAPELG